MFRSLSALLLIFALGVSSVDDDGILLWAKWANNATDQKSPSAVRLGSGQNDTNSTANCDEKEDLRDGPLCPGVGKVDYDPLRIPASLPQVHCLCSRVMSNRQEFLCQPVTMKIRVMKATDASCENMRQAEEIITVACVAVLQSRAVMNSTEFSQIERNIIVVNEPERI